MYIYERTQAPRVSSRERGGVFVALQKACGYPPFHGTTKNWIDEMVVDSCTTEVEIKMNSEYRD